MSDLYVLYHQKSNEQVFIVEIFTSENIESSKVHDFKSETFDTKETLLSECYHLLVAERLNSGFFLSLDDFNLGLESCHRAPDIVSLFEQKGEVLKISEEDKQNPVGRFLSRWF